MIIMKGFGISSFVRKEIISPLKEERKKIVNEVVLLFYILSSSFYLKGFQKNFFFI